MRAHEFITEDRKSRPEMSLRHLNHFKYVCQASAASHARQAALKRIMYANPAREHERIELEKARLDLKLQKAELAAARAEAHAQSHEAMTDMADAGSVVDPVLTCPVSGNTASVSRELICYCIQEKS